MPLSVAGLVVATVVALALLGCRAAGAVGALSGTDRAARRAAEARVGAHVIAIVGSVWTALPMGLLPGRST